MTSNNTTTTPLSREEVLLSREEVLSRLKELLREILNLETTESITPEASLAEDLNIDSLGIIDVVIGVEETFGLKLQSDLNLFEKVRTVDDAVDLVLALRGKPA